jgi:hypothetical protein
MTTPKLLAEFNRLYGPKPLVTMSADALWEYHDRIMPRTQREAGIEHLEWERTEAPIKDYEKQIGGALFGFIVGAWCFFLVAAGYW